MELAGRVRQDEACEVRIEVARDSVRLGRLGTERGGITLLCVHVELVGRVASNIVT